MSFTSLSRERQSYLTFIVCNIYLRRNSGRTQLVAIGILSRLDRETGKLADLGREILQNLAALLAKYFLVQSDRLCDAKL